MLGQHECVWYSCTLLTRNLDRAFHFDDVRVPTSSKQVNQEDEFVGFQSRVWRAWWSDPASGMNCWMAVWKSALRSVRTARSTACVGKKHIEATLPISQIVRCEEKQEHTQQEMQEAKAGPQGGRWEGGRGQEERDTRVVLKVFECLWIPGIEHSVCLLQIFH